MALMRALPSSVSAVSGIASWHPMSSEGLDDISIPQHLLHLTGLVGVVGGKHQHGFFCRILHVLGRFHLPLAVVSRGIHSMRFGAWCGGKFVRAHSVMRFVPARHRQGSACCVERAPGLSPLWMGFAVALERPVDGGGQLALNRCGMDFDAP